MRLCKHEIHKVIDDIYAPKYSTNQVLINTKKVSDKVEHYLIKFSKAPAYPDWLYFSGKDIRKSPTQKNGGGMVYVVDMQKSEPFQPIIKCEHELR